MLVYLFGSKIFLSAALVRVGVAVIKLYKVLYGGGFHPISYMTETLSDDDTTPIYTEKQRTY